MADRILVLENGHIIEQGTHAGLVAARGRYAQLFALQAQGYVSGSPGGCRDSSISGSSS